MPYFCKGDCKPTNDVRNRCNHQRLQNSQQASYCQRKRVQLQCKTCLQLMKTPSVKVTVNKYWTLVKYISVTSFLPNCMIDDDHVNGKDISNELTSTKTKVIIRFNEAAQQIRHRRQPTENQCALNFNQQVVHTTLDSPHRMQTKKKKE